MERAGSFSTRRRRSGGEEEGGGGGLLSACSPLKMCWSTLGPVGRIVERLGPLGGQGLRLDDLGL